MIYAEYLEVSRRRHNDFGRWDFMGIEMKMGNDYEIKFWQSILSDNSLCKILKEGEFLMEIIQEK